MSLIESNLDVRRKPWLVQSLQVQWSATQLSMGDCEVLHFQNSRFVLAIDLIASDQATVEAWIDTDSSRQCVLERQQIFATAMAVDGMMHIDLFGRDFERIAAISLIAQDSSDPPGQLLFAQSTLMHKSEFTHGSYDRPTLKFSGHHAQA